MPGSLLEPSASAPILFGELAPPAVLLAWSWARERLIQARNYWVTSTRSTERLTHRETMQRMCDVYNRKYDWTMEPVEDGVIDSYGAAGPAFRVIPRKVFGWGADLARPTRWSWP